MNGFRKDWVGFAGNERDLFHLLVAYNQRLELGLNENHIDRILGYGLAGASLYQYPRGNPGAHTPGAHAVPYGD